MSVYDDYSLDHSKMAFLIVANKGHASGCSAIELGIKRGHAMDIQPVCMVHVLQQA